MPNYTVNDGQTQAVDLGNVNSMTITNTSPGTRSVQAYIDYQSQSGQWASAVKGSAGYSSPITLAQGANKVVLKTDLESEHVRVGAQGDGGRVSVVY